MENASKALIIAGSVLIALLIIGALVLMFSNLTSYQKTNTETAREVQIVEFNNQYENYNRQDVRGSELYSLLNKVIDYNRRESTEGTGWSDKGQTVSYEQMTIIFKIDVSKLTADNQANKLFTKANGNTYTINRNSNTFENAIKDEVDRIEKKYGQDSLTNLTTGMTGIFIDSNNTIQQEQAVSKFNSASKKIKITKWDDIKAGSTIRNDIYKYYEYIQFKRAYFKCTNTKYNKQTARIIQMEFEFTGKFN